MDRLELESQGTQNGLWDWDLVTGRIHYSSGWISMLGWGGTEFSNSSDEWFGRIHPDESESVQREITAQVTHGAAQFEIEHRMLHQDGCYRWMFCRGMISRDGSGQAVRIRGFHVDKTSEKVVDPVTGLPNRLLLLDRLARSIEKSKKREDFLFAVLLIDLDLFESGINRLETVNTDSLVTAAARRLETSLRDRNVSIREGRAHLIARSGAEEFIVLLEGLAEAAEAKRTAEKLLKEILVPFDFDGRDVFLSPSIGISLSATGYRTAEEMLRDADTALYRAKSLGKSRCEVFDTAAMGTTRNTSRMEQELHKAISRKEFVVHYQPIVNLSTSRVAGFEALVRWNHPSRGIVPPMEFIPLAEKSGLILDLDRYILRQACLQLKTWKENPGVSSDIYVSVNLSAGHFRQETLPIEIKSILRETGIEASSLMIELTEGTVMENPKEAREILMQLRVMGARIGLDDFGTGYSSLAYLRRFPLDCLKVDRSFIRNMETSPDNLEITRAIVLLARQLGLRIIAEGIENARQSELVCSLGCEYGQGFLFSKAVEAQQAEKLLLDGLNPSPQQEPDASPLEKSNFPVPAILEKLKSLQGRKFLLCGSAMALVVMLLFLAEGLKTSPSKISVTPAAVAGMDEMPIPALLPATPPNLTAESVPVKPSSPKKPQLSTPKLNLARKAAAVEQAAVQTFDVIHDHAIGGCQGSLSIGRDTVSFASRKEKDSFSCSTSECSCSLDRDWLTIRTGGKSFRFKSATAHTRDEGRSQISEIYRILAGLQNPGPRQVNAAK